MPGPYTPRAAILSVVADQAGWSEPQFPKMVTDSGGRYTFMGAVAQDGDVVLTVLDGATDADVTYQLHATLGGVEGNPDLHDNCAVIIRPDGKILTAYTAHADTVIRLRLSNESILTTSPLSLTFATEYTIDPAVGVHDYPALIYLGSTLYLLWRNIPSGSVDAHLKYVTSTDNGATFGSATDLWNSAGKTTYWSLAVDPDATRIHVLTFDDNEGAVTNNLLKHFSFDATARYQSDGDAITAALPLAVADVDTITSTGGHHLYSLEVEHDGRVGFACSRRVSGVEGAIRGILSSGTWTVDSLGVTSTPNPPYGAVIDPFDFNHVLVALWTDSTTCDVWSYSKATGSWVGTNLTSAESAGEHVFPIFGRSRAQGAYAMIGSGNYTTYLNWDLDLVVLR